MTAHYDDGKILTSSKANIEKLIAAADLWKELQNQCLRRGFYGDVALMINIQDGTIQKVQSQVFKTFTVRSQPHE